MWRDRLIEIKKEKGMTTKMISESSGISVETITRMLNSRSTKESPRVDTVIGVCNALGVDVWEIFYMGDRSFVALQAEICLIKAERDDLLAANGALREKLDEMRDKIDSLKDEIIETHRHYIKQGRT